MVVDVVVVGGTVVDVVVVDVVVVGGTVVDVVVVVVGSVVVVVVEVVVVGGFVVVVVGGGSMGQNWMFEMLGKLPAPTSGKPALEKCRFVCAGE